MTDDLWRFQVVKYKGVPYSWTRLGFGLSCLPHSMRALLGKVLSLDERICAGMDNYIDDIVVQVSIVSV